MAADIRQLQFDDLLRDSTPLRAQRTAVRKSIKPKPARSADKPAQFAMPAATPKAFSERSSFADWLLKQEGRTDGVGQLAACARADTGFPRAGSADAVRQRLIEVEADGDTFVAVDEAEIEWDG